MTKLEAFKQYMSQFATHRGADMQWVMEASSHGRCFSHAWDEATKAEREACAQICEVIRGKDMQPAWDTAAAHCTAAIRARGEK